MTPAWDAAVEREGQALVATICDGARPLAERNRAWQTLLTRLAPRIEAWARRSSLLRRTGLSGEDELRSVLVDVIARLRDRDFANLRAFLAHQPPPEDERAEAGLLETLVRLGSGAEPAAAPATAESADLLEGTPLRGWLVNLTGFAVKDHVKRRFAYRPDAAGDEPSNKRAVNTGAERLDLQPERGTRPPLTDLLAMRRAMDEIRAYLDGLPQGMAQALRLWSEDHGFDAIAGALGLADPAAARNLVRAGQARLRERFRDHWPELFGSAP